MGDKYEECEWGMRSYPSRGGMWYIQSKEKKKEVDPMGDYEDYYEKWTYGYVRNDVKWASKEDAARMLSKAKDKIVSEKAKETLRKNFNYNDAQIDEVSNSD